MDNYGTTKTAIKFMTKALAVFFRTSFFDMVTNKDFETPSDDNPKTTKSIKRKDQDFKITTLYSNGWKSYSGGALSFTKIKEVVSTLTINAFLSLEDEIASLAAFASSLDDPESTIVTQAGDKLKKSLCQVIPGMYGDVAAGNWIGTSYATGTVTVTVTTGAVVGVGTTFTASMVGKPFKAVGHSAWYRVKTFTDTTHIVIENDSDDLASAYDGGAIAGAAFEIQGNTKVAITKSTIMQYINTMAEVLNDQEIPDDGNRWLLIPAKAKTVLLSAPEVNVDIERVHGAVVEKGHVANAGGFKIITAPTSWFTGDNTNGYYIVGGHKSFITAGRGFIEPINIIPAKDNQSGYGTLIKGLFGYGVKVADERRKAGVNMLATFSIS